MKRVSQATLGHLVEWLMTAISEKSLDKGVGNL